MPAPRPSVPLLLRLAGAGSDHARTPRCSLGPSHRSGLPSTHHSRPWRSPRPGLCMPSASSAPGAPNTSRLATRLPRGAHHPNFAGWMPRDECRGHAGVFIESRPCRHDSFPETLPRQPHGWATSPAHLRVLLGQRAADTKLPPPPGYTTSGLPSEFDVELRGQILDQIQVQGRVHRRQEADDSRLALPLARPPSPHAREVGRLESGRAPGSQPGQRPLVAV